LENNGGTVAERLLNAIASRWMAAPFTSKARPCVTSDASICSRVASVRSYCQKFY